MLAGAAHGDAAVQFTTYAEPDQYPALSPDGTKIAFHSMRSGNNDIWIIDLEDVPVVESSWGRVKDSFR